MIKQKVVIQNKSGMHARPAGELAKVAKSCDSEILIFYGEKVINAKSVLNLMAAAMKQKSEVIVQCDGITEEADLKMIVDAIESGLGEG